MTKLTAACSGQAAHEGQHRSVRDWRRSKESSRSRDLGDAHQHSFSSAASVASSGSHASGDGRSHGAFGELCSWPQPRLAQAAASLHARALASCQYLSQPVAIIWLRLTLMLHAWPWRCGWPHFHSRPAHPLTPNPSHCSSLPTWQLPACRVLIHGSTSRSCMGWDVQASSALHATEACPAAQPLRSEAWTKLPWGACCPASATSLLASTWTRYR